MKREKIVILSLCLFVSLIASMSNESTFITKVDSLVPFLFTLLGLCITAYTFIYNPLLGILNKLKLSNESNYSLHKLLESFEEDIIFIFYMTIFIIIFDILKNLNFPFIHDFSINLALLNLYSIKNVIINFFISFSASISFYALYDLIQATFKILRKSF